MSFSPDTAVHGRYRAQPAIGSSSLCRSGRLRASKPCPSCPGSKVFLKGEEIIALGQPTHRLYLVVTGTGQDVTAADQRPQPRARALPTGRTLRRRGGRWPGEPCDASMSALDNSTCLEIDRDDVYGLLEQRPELISELLPGADPPDGGVQELHRGNDVLPGRKTVRSAAIEVRRNRRENPKTTALWYRFRCRARSSRT